MPRRRGQRLPPERAAPLPRRAHRTIVTGMLAVFVACELAGLAGLAPSVLGGGLSYLLGLYHLAPSLLGGFLALLILRPRREEITAVLALAAVLAYPIHREVAPSSGPLALPVALSDALGFATLAVLAVQALRRQGAERAAVLAVLLPALVLPGFLIVASPMLHFTAVLAPTTYDNHLYLADASFGAPLSFAVAALAGGLPWLLQLCLAVYINLPVPLIVVHALRERRGVRASDTLVAFVTVMVIGYLGFLVVPVAGPYFAFERLFPYEPPDSGTMTPLRAFAPPVPRNCMPSLHSAWALLIWWSARPLEPWLRIPAGLFLLLTLLATVVTGFHYVVDLIAAFPLTMAVQAWATRVDPARAPRAAVRRAFATAAALRRAAIAVGAAMTLGWIALVTWCGWLLQVSAVVPWTLAIVLLVTSCALENEVAAVAER